jgi:hypothetical protein
MLKLMATGIALATAAQSAALAHTIRLPPAAPAMHALLVDHDDEDEHEHGHKHWKHAWRYGAPWEYSAPAWRHEYSQYYGSSPYYDPGYGYGYDYTPPAYQRYYRDPYYRHYYRSPYYHRPYCYSCYYTSESMK